MQFFGSTFGSTPVTIDIYPSNVTDRKYRDGVSGASGMPQRQYIYSTGEDIAGDVKIGVGGGRKLDHLGIKIELKGVIEVSSDKGGHSHEFVSIVRELAAPGNISGLQSYAFKFTRAELPHESYDGLNAVVRYYLRASVGRTATSAHASKELDFLVQNPQPNPDALALSAAPPAAGGNASVKLEVGIEDCLHIEFEYDGTSLALDDDVTGRVHFLLVRIRIKTMELALVRRETLGVAAAASGSASLPESETLTRFEVMDGCPVRGEVIPLRMPLAGLDLSPSFSVGGGGGGGPGAGSSSGFFSVRYFLNLVLLDEEDRRYFKSQEVTLYRREIDTGAPLPWGKGAASSLSGAGAQ